MQRKYKPKKKKLENFKGQPLQKIHNQSKRLGYYPKPRGQPIEIIWQPPNTIGTDKKTTRQPYIYWIVW